MNNPESQIEGTCEPSNNDIVEEYTFPDAQIIVRAKGKQLEVSKVENKFMIQVNKECYRSTPEAIRSAILKLAIVEQVQRQSKEDAKNMLSANPADYMRAVALTGLKHLKDDIAGQPQLKNQFTFSTNGLSNTEIFDRATEYYVLHGSYPSNIPDAVKTALNSLPALKGGMALLDALISEKYSLRDIETMQRIINEARNKLKELDIRETDQFSYKPQVGAGESEPLDPNSIETKVSPFWGGYYRGYVCKYNRHAHKIVQEASYATQFAEDSPEGDFKTYSYETKFTPEKDNCIELPYHALPLVHTLEPQNFSLYRTQSGSWYLKPMQAVQQITVVKFKFILTEHSSLLLEDEPEPVEAWGDLDRETEVFIQDLLGQTELSRIEKSRQVASYIHEKFNYPADENERNSMNQTYLSAGDGALSQICQRRIADCYWSNIFFGQLLARLGIATRLIAGHYIQKDPRFDFAPIAGIGHAWSEVWDGQEWQRKDATPPKEKSEKDENNKEEEQENIDGDFGDSSPPEAQEELTLEEIKQLFQNLLNTHTAVPTVNKAEKLFEEKVGVSLNRWNQVKSFIESVNNTGVPANSAIKGQDSTIRAEWEELFNLIYKRREIEVEAFRGPVRQSEGQLLEDPVDAVIDLISGESDPMGYKLEATRTKEETFITSFEDDSILDLTGSMQGTPVTEQKKMILTGLYNLMMLSRRLNLDKYKKSMKAPIILRSRLLSFKGSTKVLEPLGNQEDINEKAICRLFDELDKTEVGQGNLVGALQAYENGLTKDTLDKIKRGKLTKMLTVISDGEVNDKSTAIEIITRLRQKGVIVKGIGFGHAAQQIRVICHDNENPEGGVVLSDVRDGVLTKHRMLVQSLRKCEFPQTK